MSLVITTRPSGDVTVVDIAGRITLGDATVALHEKVLELIAGGQLNLVMNLSGVTFMDSAGIGEVVSAFVAVKHKRGKVKICNLTKRIRDLLQVTRLYHVLDIYASEEDALHSFG